MNRFPVLKLVFTTIALACGLFRAAGSEVAISNSSPVAFTVSSAATPAPGLGALPLPAVNKPAATNSTDTDGLKKFQMQLDLGREQRRQKSITLAQQTLSELLTNDAPTEIKRLALFELALVAQDEEKPVRAEQIFGQYIQTYPEDPSLPEVLLRQGLIYRGVGVNSLAISKFYAVMSTALKLKLDNMDYYKKIVLQAQIEIADTYYQEGHFAEAADFFARLLKTPNTDLDRGQTQFKLVHSLSYLTNYDETVAQAENYLKLYTNDSEVPEMRFCLAAALKKLGHNNDSMKQVLLLLQSQQQNVNKNPEVWAYWQRRAGNEIANQLYKEGDYFDALQIYLTLADLDKSPAWQMPVWYQTGLIYEQLQQWPKASAMYEQIAARQKDLTESNSTPSLASLVEMAQWRKGYIAWMQKARGAQQMFVLTQNTNTPAHEHEPGNR
jgi:tetratricopeptide (TPR) repeat protein